MTSYLVSLATDCHQTFQNVSKGKLKWVGAVEKSCWKNKEKKTYKGGGSIHPFPLCTSLYISTKFNVLCTLGSLQYMYAFNIVPLVSMDKNELIKQPPDVTEFPYRNVLGGSDVSKTEKRTEMQQQVSARPSVTSASF